VPSTIGFISDDVATGLLQAAGAIALCAAAIMLCRGFGVEVRREAAVSIVRGLVQMVLVGLLLAALVHGPALTGLAILGVMTLAAAYTASRRLAKLSGSFGLSLLAIAAGAGTTLIAMLATGILKTDIAVMVPVGSMIIANAMNACAQAVERFRSDVEANTGMIEAGLALGADPNVAVAPYVSTAVYASMLPRLDMLKSLGLVWIPGVMAGMLVSGADPLYAGIFQFIIVAMILSASAITGLLIILFVRSHSFSPFAQLVLRPS
jgi:putative ABC transport system permease protein